jgi:hypothetical protein
MANFRPLFFVVFAVIMALGLAAAIGPIRKDHESVPAATGALNDKRAANPILRGDGNGDNEYDNAEGYGEDDSDGSDSRDKSDQPRTRPAGTLLGCVPILLANNPSFPYSRTASGMLHGLGNNIHRCMPWHSLLVSAPDTLHERLRATQLILLHKGNVPFLGNSVANVVSAPAAGMPQPCDNVFNLTLVIKLRCVLNEYKSTAFPGFFVR